MADEITVTLSLAFSKGGVGSTMDDSGLQFDVSGTDYVQGTQNVGTSEEVLGKGDITTPGYCYIKNIDTTNYVEVFGATGETATIKIKAGEAVCFRFANVAPCVKANTSDVQIDYLLVED